MPKKSADHRPATPLSSLLRIPQGPVDLARLDPGSAPGYPGRGKDDALRITEAMAPELSDLQERLFANARADESYTKRILVLLQGMDTSGKGGVIRHAIGMVDPQGVALKAFKAPTAEERAHDFLWRIRNAVPAPGMIGVFDRSQYEDVLIVRVENLVPPEEWGKRYDLINAFEAELSQQGVTLIKCFLNVSKAEQKARLLERLASPEKYWKYNPGDVDVRVKWPRYAEAYSVLLERCNTDVAPWYHVPADKKWYRNWAVAELLREHLVALDPQWPSADFDVSAEQYRVENS